MAAQNLPPEKTTVQNVEVYPKKEVVDVQVQKTENVENKLPDKPPTENSIPPKPKSKISKVIIYVFIAIAILAAGFFLFRFFSTRNSNKDTNLVWWGLWEDSSIVGGLIEQYEQENPGISITYIKQSKEDYRERLTNSLAKGEGPDIFRYHNTWVPMFTKELDQLPSTVINPADFVQTFYPVASSDLADGSGIVGLPLEIDGLGLFINKTIFEENGKADPATWNELRQTAKDLTIKNERGEIIRSGVALGRTENVDHWPDILGLMMLQNGVDLNNPVGGLAEGALSFFTAFAKTDRVWDESLPTSTAAFAGEKVAMYFGPSWRVFEILELNPNLNFKVIPVPQLPDEESVDKVTYSSYWAEGVWSRSDNKEESWNFLRYLSSQESLQALFDSASRTRLFGEPYSRTDMAGLLTDHPYLGAFISQAGDMQSWYLASRTFDGPTGINSQIISYFEDAVNAVNGGSKPEDVLETLASGVTQVLTQYGLK